MSFHFNCCNMESLKWCPNWAVSRQVNDISAHRAIFFASVLISSCNILVGIFYRFKQNAY